MVSPTGAGRPCRGASVSEEGAGPRPQPFRTARADTPSRYHSAFTDHQTILGSPGPAAQQSRRGRQPCPDCGGTLGRVRRARGWESGLGLRGVRPRYLTRGSRVGTAPSRRPRGKCQAAPRGKEGTPSLTLCLRAAQPRVLTGVMGHPHSRSTTRPEAPLLPHGCHRHARP